MNSTVLSLPGRLLTALERAGDRYRYLALFRVYLAFHIVKKLLIQWPFSQMLYSNQSFVVSGLRTPPWMHVPFWQAHYDLVLSAYLLSALFLGLGVGRRWSAVAVAGLTILVQQMGPYTLNGGDNLLRFLVMYLPFCDSFRHLAVQRSRAGTGARGALDNACTRIGLGLMTAHFVFIYAVSACGKIHADVWYNGTANYYILSLDRFRAPLSGPFVRNAVFVMGSTYLTLLWEFSLPFLIWHRQWRWAVIAVGLCIHAGIYLFMMIHDFEILFVMTYGLFIRDDEWERAGARLRDVWRRLGERWHRPGRLAELARPAGLA